MAQPEIRRYDELADADLLDRFVTGQDEAAFAEIVRRYHALVLGVCRRRLRCPHDAEDAFQATFLVLAQKGCKIRRRNALASWLYGVAYRVALRLSRSRAAGAVAPLEEPPMVHDDPLKLLAERHEQLVTDEELAALPESLRAPLVLRYVSGKSNEEVAEELEISVAAVEGRLKRAKHKLRGKLARRGVALSTTLAALGAAPPASAHAIEPLIAQTLVTCFGGTAATASGTGTCSSTALQLAHKEATAMTLFKVSNVAAVAALVVCTSTLGWGLQQALSQTASDDPFGDAPASGLTLEQADTAGEGGGSGRLAVAPSSRGQGAAAGAGGTASPATTTSADSDYDLVQRSEDEIAIRAALNKETATLDFFDIPLEEAIDEIERQHDFHIELDRGALLDAGVDTATPITASYRGMSLRSALKLMLDELDLTYLIEEEYLLITTPEEAEQRLDTRIYPLRSKWGVQATELIEAVTATVHPTSWEEVGGPGSIKPLGDNLVISQTQEVHDDIKDLLRQLDTAAKLREQSTGREGLGGVGGYGRRGGYGEGGYGEGGYGEGGYGEGGGVGPPAGGGYGGGYRGGYGGGYGEGGVAPPRQRGSSGRSESNSQQRGERTSEPSGSDSA